MSQNILVLLKTSGFDRFMKDDEGKERFLRLRKYTQDELRTSHLNQQDFEIQLQTAIQRLQQDMEATFTFTKDTDLDGVSVSSFDTIITCGGDGTFLTAAQRFPDIPLVGLNSDMHSDPKKGSIGALTLNVPGDKLPFILQRIASNQFKIKEWKRLYAALNGKKGSLYAVNDIYFGPTFGYQTCDFRLRANGDYEDFNSSGLIVSTGMGSTAWFRNAGGTIFNNNLDAFGFVVREPNLKRHPGFTSGILQSGQELTVEPSRDGYILASDSQNQTLTELKIHDTVTIGLDEQNPIKNCTFLKRTSV